MSHDSFARNPDTVHDENEAVDIGRYRELNKTWRITMAVMTATATALAINQIFNLGFLMDQVMLDGRYLYLITGIMLCMVFITFPANK